MDDIDDAEIWEVKQVLKARTMRFVGGLAAALRERLAERETPAVSG